MYRVTQRYDRVADGRERAGRVGGASDLRDGGVRAGAAGGHGVWRCVPEPGGDGALRPAATAADDIIERWGGVHRRRAGSGAGRATTERRRSVCLSEVDPLAGNAPAGDLCGQHPGGDGDARTVRPDGECRRPSPPPSPPALLVGTEEGEVYRLSRERPHWRCLWQAAAGEPVRGLLAERAAHRDRGGHTVILVGTPHRLYWLLDALLDTTGAPDTRVHFLEVPSTDDTPSPTPLWHRVQGALVGRVAWLADGGLLCAELRLPELADGSSRVLSNKTWIPLPSARQNDEV
eukprot:ctg_3301.g476